MASGQIDQVVIGGGFYGCMIAALLAERGQRVALIEREPQLMRRASYNNQARVHQGYHYPRSFLTGIRSALNYPRFVRDFAACVDDSFEHVYAIARTQSRTNAYQFRQFCARIGAPLRPAPASTRKLFNDALIEDCVVVRECAFNAAALREQMRVQLLSLVVDVRLGVRAIRVERNGAGLRVVLDDGAAIHASNVFNCTYAGINTLLRESGLPLLGFKHELTEMALVQMPPALRKMGFTIMDGPFFSTIPFPDRELHTFSHVRYTPHRWWIDRQEFREPYAELERYRPESNGPYMLSDARRYLPALAGCEQVDSLFEIKTILIENEIDDGRPILLRQNYGLEGFHTLMGGKIDNVYDVLQALGLMRGAAQKAATRA